MKTGIITALSSEARCLTGNTCQPGIATSLSASTLLVLSGMGKKRVQHAIEELTSNDVELLVSFGTAAALDPQLQSGDVVIPGKIILANNDVLEIGNSHRDKVLTELDSFPFNLHTGDVCDSDRVIGSPMEKLELFGSKTAQALDMESGLIAGAATSLQLPVLVIRVIVDEASTSIPSEVLECCDELGEVKPASLSLAILKKPGLVCNLLTLNRHFGKAQRAMKWLSKNLALINDAP